MELHADQLLFPRVGTTPTTLVEGGTGCPLFLRCFNPFAQVSYSGFLCVQGIYQMQDRIPAYIHVQILYPVPQYHEPN